MIYLIISKYLDGEIKEIIGFTDNEADAKSKVKKLSKNIKPHDSYIYDYTLVTKII